MSVARIEREARSFAIRVVADRPELAAAFINCVTLNQFQPSSLSPKGYGGGLTDFLVESTYTDLSFQSGSPEEAARGGPQTWRLFQGGVLLLDLSRVVSRIDLLAIVPTLGIPEDCAMLLAGILPENPENREVTSGEAQSLAKQFNLPYFEIDLRQEQQATEAVAQLVSAMIRRRFPAWSPGQQLPPVKLDAETIEARNRRREQLIRLLEIVLSVEKSSVENLTRELEKAQLLPVRRLLTGEITNGRSRAEQVKIIIETLKTGSWPPRLRRNARLNIVTEYATHVQRSSELVRDAILVSVDESLKHGLNVIAANMKRVEDIDIAQLHILGG